MSTSSGSRSSRVEYIGDSMQSTANWPFATISRGRHAGPDDGACLMELASLLAGEPWTDSPQAVQPVLASVARAVNDRVADDTRARLALLVPAMLHTAGTGVRGCAAVVAACAEAALETADQCDVATRCGLEAARRRAHRILAGRGLSGRLRARPLGVPLAGLLDWAYCHGAVLRTAEAVAVVANAGGDPFADPFAARGATEKGRADPWADGPGPDPDEKLERLLRACAGATAEIAAHRPGDQAARDSGPASDPVPTRSLGERGDEAPADATLVGT